MLLILKLIYYLLRGFDRPGDSFHVRRHAGSIKTTQHKGSHQYAISSHLVESWNRTLKTMPKSLGPEEAVAQTYQSCFVCLFRSRLDSAHSIALIHQYYMIGELSEYLEDSLKNYRSLRRSITRRRLSKAG